LQLAFTITNHWGPGPPPPFNSLLQHLTWRHTRPADQPAHLASARRPSPPL